MRLALLAVLGGALALLAPAGASAEYGEAGHRDSVLEFSRTGRVTTTETTYNPPYPFLRQDEKRALGVESLEELEDRRLVGVEVQLDGRSSGRRLR